MNRGQAFFSTLLLTAALGPGSAAAVSPTLCGDALDLDPSDVVSASLTAGDPAMVDVRSQLGTSWFPFEGSTMCLLSTGIAASVATLLDHDWPGSGPDTSAGDRVTLTWELAVPPWANSLWIRSNFFTREYPEWVGSEFNDAFEIDLAGSAFTGQILFDVFGNLVTVNSGFFVVTNPTFLTGTGFDSDGATGWLVTAAPVQGGDVITLSASLYDVADGVWDSAALIDFFEWSNVTLQLPYTTHADEDGLPSGELPPLPDGPAAAFVTPKTLPLSGGPLTIKGQLFTEGMPVYLGGAEVSYDLLDDQTLRVDSAPSALELGLPNGGPVHLQVGQRVLPAAVTYVAVKDAPHIERVGPSWLPSDSPGSVAVIGDNLAGAYWEFVGGDGETWSPTEITEDAPDESGTQRVLLTHPPLPRGVVILRVFTRDRGEASQLLAVQPTSPDLPARELVDGDSASCAQGASPPSWLALLLLFPLRRRGGSTLRCDS